MATAKPIAIVSPMKKVRKTSKKKSSKNNNLRKHVHENKFDDSESLSEKSVDDLSLEKKSNRLCAMFENMDIATRDDGCEYNFQNSNLRIPEHDKKILERMAAKMKRDICNSEVARRAHIAWENEREAREKLQKEQANEYNKFIQGRRKAEKEMSERKLQELKEICDWQKEHLRNIISCKDNTTERRLKEIEFKKNCEIKWKHKLAEEKARNVFEVIKEQKVAELMWRKKLAENLEQRVHNAGTNREILLKYSRQKSVIDNRVHEELQRRNWKDQQHLRMERLTLLKRKLQEKNRKIQRIQCERDTFMRESRRLADSTAKLREEVKRSLSPDIFLRGSSLAQNQHYRSSSQLNYASDNLQSHIRLG